MVDSTRSSAKGYLEVTRRPDGAVWVFPSLPIFPDCLGVGGWRQIGWWRRHHFTHIIGRAWGVKDSEITAHHPPPKQHGRWMWIMANERMLDEIGHQTTTRRDSLRGAVDLGGSVFFFSRGRNEVAGTGLWLSRDRAETGHAGRGYRREVSGLTPGQEAGQSERRGGEARAIRGVGGGSGRHWSGLHSDLW